MQSIDSPFNQFILGDKMKVKNMTSSKGNKIANQFIITDEMTGATDDRVYRTEVFQSYESSIVRKEFYPSGSHVVLDRDKWDYSVTTGKYRNQFLGETKKETQAKIDSGEYKLVDLN